MLFKTHFVFGLFIYLLLFLFVWDKIVFGLFLFLGVFLVDLDSRKSFINKIFFLKIISFLFGALVFAVFSAWGGLGFLVGGMSHLFLDLFSGKVNLFWPFDYRIGFELKSGGIIENFLFVALILFDSLLILYFMINFAIAYF